MPVQLFKDQFLLKLAARPDQANLSLSNRYFRVLAMHRADDGVYPDLDFRFPVEISP